MKKVRGSNASQASVDAWYKLLAKYDIKPLSRNGGVIFFLLGDRMYYYGMPSKQIRRKGNSIWTKGVVKMLKEDFNNKIPLKGTSEKGVPIEYVNFGKYIGHLWSAVVTFDLQYIDWVLLNSKDGILNPYLEELKANNNKKH